MYVCICMQILICALMCKKGGNLMPTWKMRWFILTSSSLLCYESKEIFVKKVTND